MILLVWRRRFFIIISLFWNRKLGVGFEIFVAVTVNVAVFLVTALWSLVEAYRYFRGTCCPADGDSKYLWNVGELLPDYVTLQPRRQPYLKLWMLKKIRRVCSWLGHISFWFVLRVFFWQGYNYHHHGLGYFTACSNAYICVCGHWSTIVRLKILLVWKTDFSVSFLVFLGCFTCWVMYKKDFLEFTNLLFCLYVLTIFLFLSF
jgi:hypothetical protein